VSRAFVRVANPLLIDVAHPRSTQLQTVVSFLGSLFRDEGKTADLRIEGDTLEAMSRELFRPRLYVNNKVRNQVAVVNTFTRKLIASWPVAPESDNVAMALDERHRLLFVGCRTGQIAVLDTDTGKYQQSLSIPKLIDDLAFDPATGRIYASGDGEVAVYEEKDRTHFNLLANVPTGPAARTALLVPSLSRYFVAVPGTKTSAPKILVYELPAVGKASPAAMAATAAATCPYNLFPLRRPNALS
jgi:hypothetical protein